MVHRREIEGRELVLGNHGALWGNAMTWWDTETGSVWSQPIGEAILGPLAGERLDLLPSSLTTWADWMGAHPDTLALAVDSGDDGFDLESMAIVVELGRSSVAYPFTELRGRGVVNDVVNDVPVAVVLDPDTDTWRVFSGRLDSETIELDLLDGALIEVGGSRRFDVSSGLALDAGGQSLDRLPGFTSFPRDYVTFFPRGAFWTGDGLVTVESIIG